MDQKDRRTHTEVISLDLIDRDPGQPRQYFDEEEIKKLAKSIKKEGLIQKLLVKPHSEYPKRYMLIAGERRFRALTLLGEAESECVVLEGRVDTFTLSLVENLHRVDLNPIEEAEAVKRLREDKRMTWPEIEDLTGRSQPTMANKLKLLDLPRSIQEMVIRGSLPQVTALSLAQYKGERGKFFRLAHDLIMGKEPIELRTKSHPNVFQSRRMIESKLPDDALGLLKRVVDFGWRASSTSAALEKFMELSLESQKAAMRALSSQTREAMRQNFVSITRMTLRFLEEVIKPSIQQEIGKKAKATPPSPRPTSPRPQLPPDNEQPVTLSQKVLWRLLYSEKGRPGVNLSASALRESLDWTDSERELHEAAVNAFRALKERWRVPIVGDADEKKFRSFVTRVRVDFGDLTFPQFFEGVQKADSSEDSMNLDYV